MEQKPIDEIFCFSCTCCGDCCTGNMKININLYDLYKIARRLGFTNTNELFNKGLVDLVKVQNDVWTPQIQFKKFPYPFCPWLINDLGEDNILRGFCSLHPHDKPLICKIAPAGRVVDTDTNQISYILTEPTEHCPGMKGLDVNKLSELKETLKIELDFELRFYRFMDSSKVKKMNKEEMLNLIYCFPIENGFEIIMAELEEKLKNDRL